MRYLALLRGINVGGKNIIKMADLRECFSETLGFTKVKTYIQSGNLLFETSERSQQALTKKIQRALKEVFAYEAPVLLLSQRQLKQVVKEAPKGFGQDLDRYRCDVLFLFPSLSAEKAREQIQTREGVDELSLGKRALYFSRLTAQASKSYLPKLTQLPIYQQITVRNWRTTRKLLAIMEKMAEGL